MAHKSHVMYPQQPSCQVCKAAQIVHVLTGNLPQNFQLRMPKATALQLCHLLMYFTLKYAPDSELEPLLCQEVRSMHSLTLY